MSEAIAGVGTKFYKWVTNAWVAVAEVVSVTGPGASREMIDVTSLDSVGGYREFIGGFRDGGDIQLNMNYTRAGYDLMRNDYEDDDIQNYQIVLNDTLKTSVEFAGFVQEVPLTIPTDDKVTMDVTIKISGPIVVDSGMNSDSPAV